MNKKIRKAVSGDRKAWLENMLESGSWEDIKRLRKRPAVHSRKLEDQNGRIVESNERAETFADHLERVQWAVRPLDAMVANTPIGPMIPT